jgi:hypothetical protein
VVIPLVEATLLGLEDLFRKEPTKFLEVLDETCENNVAHCTLSKACRLLDCLLDAQPHFAKLLMAWCTSSLGHKQPQVPER